MNGIANVPLHTWTQSRDCHSEKQRVDTRYVLHSPQRRCEARSSSAKSASVCAAVQSVEMMDSSLAHEARTNSKDRREPEGSSGAMRLVKMLAANFLLSNALFRRANGSQPSRECSRRPFMNAAAHSHDEHKACVILSQVAWGLQRATRPPP